MELVEPPVYVVGYGARTPLGFGAAPSAAAQRAGLSAVTLHPLIRSRLWKVWHAAFDPELDREQAAGPARLLELAGPAAREACAPLAGLRPSPRLAVFLGLPEVRPGFTREDADAVRAGLQWTDLPGGVAEVTVFPEGHAAGLRALATAADRIRNGTAEACLVGGVDSYFHPATLVWLDGHRQLSDEAARSAFVPGEGAGFCLLTNRRVRDLLGVPAPLRVVRTAVGRETKVIKSDAVCLGEGLTEVVRAVLPPLGGKVNDVYCDLNGERYRGEEWGFVGLRLSAAFDDPSAYVSPADCWGDLGAAAGPLGVMLAGRAAAGGYAGGPRTLVWASSEGGLRGAALLEAPDNT